MSGHYSLLHKKQIVIHENEGRIISFFCSTNHTMPNISTYHDHVAFQLETVATFNENNDLRCIAGILV